MKLTCVEEWVRANGVPGATMLAAILCEGPENIRDDARIYGQVLQHIEAGAFWTYFGDFQGACPRYRESYFTIDAFRFAELINPTWGASIVASIRAEIVFEPTATDGAVQLLGGLARRGDESSRLILEYGGRGAFGGTAAQVLRAASISMGLQQSALEKLAYVDSLLQSRDLPTESRLADMCINLLLLDRAAWPDGNCQPAFEAMFRVLEDSRLGSAAAGRLADMPIEEGSACAELHRALRERAQRIRSGH